MIRTLDDLIPRPLRDEMLRLATLDRDWVEVYFAGDTTLEGVAVHEGKFSCRSKHDTFIEKIWRHASEGLAILATSHWLVDGPKIFRPTLEQCQALEQIEVRLAVSEYAQPYPTLLVDLPTSYLPITSVLCGLYQQYLVLVVDSVDHDDDISTVVDATSGKPIEGALSNFYDVDLQRVAHLAWRTLRIAVNSCLMLTNYPTLLGYLYPKEVQSDQRLARENTERGQRARSRLRVAPQLVRFEHEVVLHHTEGSKSNDGGTGEPTGREVVSHWRRGHWAMQPYGPKNSLRKRILRKPVLVHADKAVGISTTTTVYHT